MPYSIITAKFKNQFITCLLIKIIGYYIIVSVLSLMIVDTVHNIEILGVKIAICVFGTFFYYTLSGDDLNKRHKEAISSYDYENIRLINSEYIIQLISVGVLVILFFIPTLSINPITIFVINILNKIYNIPGVVGNIINIIMALYGAYQIIITIAGTIFIIITLIKTIFIRKKETI
ncbi:MAG: hypothetical protein ACFFDF_00240 [Candidatus Odinarchaeota archaeon]